MGKVRPHHHGNLRAALVEAGVAILEAEGLEGLSLRKAAARAGVSHAAPAHHFGNMDGLMWAITAHAFRTFCRLMEEEREKAGPEPRARLEGICRGYIRFAGEHEALFQLAFATDRKAPCEDAEYIEAARRATEILVETCAPFATSPNGPMVNEIMVWSLVHGYASLKRFGRLTNPGHPDLIPFGAILPDLPLKE